MKTRRRFTAKVKAKVAFEAIRGERTISELATKHQLHPNQITQWKRQATENLAKGFGCTGQPGRRVDEATRQDRPARRRAAFFGQGLRSLSLDRRRMMINPGHPRLSIRRQCELVYISRASFYRKPRKPRTDPDHRRGLHGNALVWVAPDGAASAPPRLVRRPQACPEADAQDRSVADLPSAEDQRTASAASHLSLPAATLGD